MTIADRASAIADKIGRTFVDDVTIKRFSSTATDSEGNPSGTPTLVATVPGRWQSPTAAELDLAAQSGQRLDSTVTVALGTDIQPGDVAEVNGTWRVGSVMSDRVQTKATLSRWGG
jgi:hypothetical protein